MPDQPRPINYCECGEEAIVTVGLDHVPLCITHLEQWVNQTKDDQ